MAAGELEERQVPRQMAVDLCLAREIRQPALQKLSPSTMITSLKEDVRHGMGTVTAVGMEFQSPLHQTPRLLMIPQFVVCKRIGTQKPPVVAICLSNALQQRKIGLQAILATTKPNHTKWSNCLLEEKNIPRKFLHMLADQR